MTAAAKAALPELPELEASPQAHLDFANAALKRRWNRIARIRKFGNAAPLVVLVFENGDELALTAPQHRYGAGLIDQLASYDGQLCPSYTAPQLRVVYAALIRASDLWEADSQHDELLLDVDAFVGRCVMANDTSPLLRPDPRDDEQPDNAMFRAVSDFQTLNEKRSGHPSEQMPIPLFWRYPRDFNDRDTIEMWLPRQALATYLRAVKNWMAGPQVRNTLRWFGWDQRELHLRSKIDWHRRVHARIWTVPVPWEASETDLLGVVNGEVIASPNVPTSPGGPSSYTRASTRNGGSRARRGGDVRGRGT